MSQIRAYNEPDRAPPAVKPTTVAHVLTWYDSQEAGASASLIAAKERRRIRALFRDQYGVLLLEECCPFHLSEFIAKQAGAKSNWTKRRFKTTINAAFNKAAIVWRIANPFRGVKYPEGGCGRDWTYKEYRAIRRASPRYFKALVMFLRYSGARPGEARKITWPDVHEEFKAIVLAQHKTAHLGPEPRRIPFNWVIVRILASVRAENRHPLYVFVNKFRQPWTIKALTKHFRHIARRAGVPEDVKPHGGRHTFTTRGLMNGVDIATMAQLLGHRSVKTTERYLHLVNKREYLNAASNRAIGRKGANSTN